MAYIVWGIVIFAFICGGIVPFAWVFLPEAHAGCESDKEAREWGAYMLARNKRQAPQVCADMPNNEAFGD